MVTAQMLDRVDPKSSRKHVWRAKIVLLISTGLGTHEIMQQTGKSKPYVWRWQDGFMAEGGDGLLRDKTRPPGKLPLAAAIVTEVLEKNLRETPPEATHGTDQTMAKTMDLAPSTAQKI